VTSVSRLHSRSVGESANLRRWACGRWRAPNDVELNMSTCREQVLNLKKYSLLWWRGRGTFLRSYLGSLMGFIRLSYLGRRTHRTLFGWWTSRRRRACLRWRTSRGRWALLELCVNNGSTKAAGIYSTLTFGGGQTGQTSHSGQLYSASAIIQQLVEETWTYSPEPPLFGN
jgi:hypothetical protein